VAGPVSLATPAGVARRVDVRSAAQMREAVLGEARGTDIYIGAAAVGDYRPVQAAPRKLKKHEGTPLVLELAENPDILMELAAAEARPFLVGFAAETHDVASYAQGKLARKGLDMIAANRVGEGLGFEAEDNALSVYWPGGGEELPRASKCELAARLVECVAQRYRAARA
ncbi:phosphopantothenoylcysteine decarboxylase, partial [Frateuria sp.]|uniref:phosphopantothenoylcysteine decarboxylase domain-containing protein n=1 Tax=Frateuria sp. TaxID=2211372 RepID=UPI0017BBD672